MDTSKSRKSNNIEDRRGAAVKGDRVVKPEEKKAQRPPSKPAGPQGKPLADVSGLNAFEKAINKSAAESRTRMTGMENGKAIVGPAKKSSRNPFSKV